MTDIIASTTKSAVMSVLRNAERPLSVSEIRARVRTQADLRVHRSTIASTLKRLAVESAAAYDDAPDGPTQLWYALPALR